MKFLCYNVRTKMGASCLHIRLCVCFIRGIVICRYRLKIVYDRFDPCGSLGKLQKVDVCLLYFTYA